MRKSTGSTTTGAENALEGGKTMRDLSGAKHPATKAVWAGEEGYLAEGATQVPIVQSIPFGYDDLDEWTDVALGEREGHIYSRNTNPTTHAFEEKVRVLEGAEDSTSFATGMAAISNTLYAFLKPGEDFPRWRSRFFLRASLLLVPVPRW